MDSIIRGTTPSLIVDFSGVTAFTVSDITAVALTITNDKAWQPMRLIQLGTASYTD